MIAPFDIFQTHQDGTALWRGTAGTLEEAKSLIAKLSAGSPGEYVIVSLRTGNKQIIRSDEDIATE